MDIMERAECWATHIPAEGRVVLWARSPWATWSPPEADPVGGGAAGDLTAAVAVVEDYGYHVVGEWESAGGDRRVVEIAPAQLVNLTPHPVTVGGVTIPPAGGELPRVEEHTDPIACAHPAHEGVVIPVHTVTLGEVTGLPERRPDRMLIVSRMVAEAARERRDLVYPIGQIRDSKNRIVGAAGLGRLPQAPAATRTTGWDEHGHARRTGLPIDAYLGRGDLQDAENCGYEPTSVLAELDVDQAHGAPDVQFRAGRIVLRDGTVLERGGTLSAVWAVTRLPSGV